MRSIYFLISIIIFILFTSHVHASTIIDTDITQDSQWDQSQSPYVISTTMTIASSTTLTINPGTTIQFDGGTIVVSGKIIASGTDTQQISITSLDSNNNGGIVFLNAQGTSTIEHTNFSYLGTSIESISSHLLLNNDSFSYSMIGIESNNSIVDSKNLSMNNLGKNAINLFNNSRFNISSSTLEDSNGNAISAYNSSELIFDKGVIQNIQGAAFVVDNNSRADIHTIHIDSTHDRNGNTIILSNNSSLTLNNSTIKKTGNNAAFLEYGNSNAIIDSSEFTTGDGNGIEIYSNSAVHLTHSSIEGFIQNGILGFNGGTISISDSQLKGNSIGFQLYTPVTVTIASSSIYDNTEQGILNNSGLVINAEKNWWGDTSGPKHPTSNPNGKGNSVSDNVDFSEWLDRDPKQSVVICCSNVLFIPGIEASRLYKKGILFENQLWEPNISSDVKKLFMTPAGKSIDPTIYTRDIINRTNLPVFNQDIYRSFSASMDGLVNKKVINQWQAYPYDWRLDIPDIVSNGSLQQDGTYKKIIPFLEDLASTSLTGKVTIVAHSNGGLIAKALIQTLETQHKENLLDTVVLVASPQLGTPESIAALLHGYDQSIGGGWILSTSTARTFALNAPMTYNLLPSQKFMDLQASPLITFDASLNSISNLYKTYGSSINNYSQLTAFLNGTLDHRTQPTSNNLINPAVANNLLYTKAEQLHSNLDTWQLPSSIKIYQVVGTGRDTVSGIAYTNNKEKLDYMPLFSTSGDGTVLGKSASALNGEIYYINLPKYNNETNHNIMHATILESDPVQNLIQSIIQQKTNIQNPYISTLALSALPQTKISIHSPVSLDLYDSLGHHTGLASTTLTDDDVLAIDEQIPNSYYMSFGEGVYTGTDPFIPTNVVLQGTDVGTFTLTIENPTSSITYQDIPVLPETTVAFATQNATSTPLQVDFDGDGNIDSVVTSSSDIDPVIYLQSLKRIITSFDIKSALKVTLLNKVDKVIQKIQSGKLKTADQLIKKYSKALETKRKFTKKLTSEEKELIVTFLSGLLDNLNN